MVSYNFKKQFVPKIESGEKTTTIRANRKNSHVKLGGKMQLYTGMRTKSCRLIEEVKCIEERRFSVHHFEPDLLCISLDNELLKPAEYQKLIYEDGFKNIQEFYNFFLDAETYRFDGWFFRWESLLK